MERDEFDDYLGNWRDASGFAQTNRDVAGFVHHSSEEDSPSESERSASSSDSDAWCLAVSQPRAKHRLCERLQRRYPGTYAWFRERLGEPIDYVVVGLFVVFDAWSFRFHEASWLDNVNVSSVVVVANLLSLATSLTVTFSQERRPEEKRRLLDWHVFWRFAVAALFFQSAWRLKTFAYMVGTLPIVVKTLGYIYLPLSAVASWVIFRRGYGLLEWLALLMMCLAMEAFILLRERCRAGSCADVERSWASVMEQDAMPKVSGPAFVISGVLLSCMASLLCERIYKESSPTLRERGRAIPYSVHKVHLDLCGVVVALVIWSNPFRLAPILEGQRMLSWFGEWTPWTFLRVIVITVHWWMSGEIARRYSTVTKAIVQTVTISLVVLFQDSETEKFEPLLVPSLCMTVVILLSALIFQTGRINIAIASASFASDKVMRVSTGLKKALRDVVNLRKQKEAKGGKARKPLTILLTYSVLLAYIVLDALRQVLYSKAVGQSMITPQSFSLALNAAGLCLSHVLLFEEKGLAAVKEAWQMRKILDYFFCGFLFALTSALTSLAYGNGLSSAMNMVLGKVYLPISTLASRFLLKRYYMWLEYFAIFILFVDSAAFGWLRSVMGSGSAETPRVAVIACLASATSAALNSIVMEQQFSKEMDKPWMMKKLRTDVACLFWSAVFLPIMGWLGDWSHFSKGAYWNWRPLTMQCGKLGACGAWGAAGFAVGDGGDFAWYGANHTSFLHEGDIACSCTKGVFAAWGTSYWLYVTLAVSVAYSFVTGLVVKDYGGVLRAVADNFSLILVYCVGDPLVNDTNLRDMSLNLTAGILPLSSLTFNQAASELKAVQKIKAQHVGASEEYATARTIEVHHSGSSDEDGEESDSSEAE